MGIYDLFAHVALALRSIYDLAFLLQGASQCAITDERDRRGEGGLLVVFTIFRCRRGVGGLRAACMQVLANISL